MKREKERKKEHEEKKICGIRFSSDNGNDGNDRMRWKFIRERQTVQQAAIKNRAEATSGKEKITLRIGSGHSESNPWITALEDYFVKNVSERVSEETNYEIDWVKSYGGSVISWEMSCRACRMVWSISDVRFWCLRHPDFRYRIWFTVCRSPAPIR
ncbi:MAG: hypothetical protein ACLT76_14210 [Clostridium fessum]